MVLFTVIYYWTNSDGYNGNDLKFFDNYDNAYNYYQKLKKKVYPNINHDILYITFNNEKYVEHFCNNNKILQYIKDKIEIKDITIEKIYDFISINYDINIQITINSMKNNGEYIEYMISEEGYFKRPECLELRVIDDNLINGDILEINKLPKYRTY
jgi:hypothetical protein